MTPPQEFVPTAGGVFTFDNGSGAPDVGPFKFQIPINAAVWSNMASLSTIDRSKGATLTWTGGDNSTYVLIVGSSMAALSATSYVEGLFTCAAPASAHQFTIPSAIMLALPPSPAGIANTNLMFISNTAPIVVPIPGLDLAFFTGSIATSVTATYK
jgi:hypothetical protein